MKIHRYITQDWIFGVVLLVLLSFGGMAWWAWSLWIHPTQDHWPTPAPVEQLITPTLLISVVSSEVPR